MWTNGGTTAVILNVGCRRTSAISLWLWPLYLRAKGSGKHSTGGWVGGRGGLTTRRREKSRVFTTNQTIIPRLSNPQVSVNVLPKSGIESRFPACTNRSLFNKPTASTRTELNCVWTRVIKVRTNCDRATITNMATMRNICGFTQSSNETLTQL